MLGNTVRGRLFRESAEVSISRVRTLSQGCCFAIVNQAHSIILKELYVLRELCHERLSLRLQKYDCFSTFTNYRRKKYSTFSKVGIGLTIMVLC